MPSSTPSPDLGSWLPGLPMASAPQPLVLAPAAPLRLPGVTVLCQSPSRLFDQPNPNPAEQNPELSPTVETGPQPRPTAPASPTSPPLPFAVFISKPYPVLEFLGSLIHSAIWRPNSVSGAKEPALHLAGRWQGRLRGR